MGPKLKKDKGSTSTTAVKRPSTPNNGQKPRNDHIDRRQVDHEYFLQAFEKPTQIYRYLATRNMVSPVFLNRTLTFMKKRMSRASSEKVRHSFKVDSLLKRKESDNKSAENSNLERYLNLTLLGYCDKKLSAQKPLDKVVTAEFFLVRLTPKKRKDLDSTYVQIPIGTTEVPINPSDEHPPSKASALSIPLYASDLTNGHHMKSCTLLARIHFTPLSQLNGTYTKQQHDLNSEGECSMNGSTNDLHENNPNSILNGTSGDSENQEPAMKRRRTNRENHEVPKSLTSELDLYDKHQQGLVEAGEYEILMRDTILDNKSSIQTKNATWEHINGGDKKDAMPHHQFQDFECAPRLRFKLNWSSDPLKGIVERPKPLTNRDNFENDSVTQNNSSSSGNGGGVGNHHNNRKDRSRLSRQSSSNVSANNNSLITAKNSSNHHHHNEKPPRIVYQFCYNRNSRQQTEAREDLHCPWCMINCMELYALLKHLKLSHPRFLFTYVPIQDGARIDVSVSELYDSTYVGNPHDMISQPPGYAFSRGGPIQRTSITHVLVCKPKMQSPSLDEFLEIEENDLNGPYNVDGQRPFVSGHNRVYHDSTTHVPHPPYAINLPSLEDRVDPPWLMKKICRMIDEFSDVNGGEKELMKMWNLHIQHYTFVGDCQISLALKMFIEEKGRELLAKNLYRNFVVHVCNLFEFGVLGPAHVFSSISRMQEFIRDHSHKFSSWPEQRSHWQNRVKDEPIAVPTEKFYGKSSTRRDFSGIFPKDKRHCSVVLEPLDGLMKKRRSQSEDVTTAVARTDSRRALTIDGWTKPSAAQAVVENNTESKSKQNRALVLPDCTNKKQANQSASTSNNTTSVAVNTKDQVVKEDQPQPGAKEDLVSTRLLGISNFDFDIDDDDDDRSEGALEIVEDPNVTSVQVVTASTSSLSQDKQQQK